MTKDADASGLKTLELEDALTDVQLALENERAEVERLRANAPSEDGPSASDETHRIQNELAAVKKDRDAAQAELASVVRKVDELETTVVRLTQENAEHQQKAASPSHEAGDDEALRIRIASLEARAEKDTRTLKNEVRSHVVSISVAQYTELAILGAQISELEALLENKIYREAELEAELQELKRRAQDAGVDLSEGSRPGSSLLKTARASLLGEEGACEMCGAKDHEVDACPLCENKRPSSRSSCAELRVLQSVMASRASR